MSSYYKFTEVRIIDKEGAVQEHVEDLVIDCGREGLYHCAFGTVGKYYELEEGDRILFSVTPCDPNGFTNPEALQDRFTRRTSPITGRVC